MDAPFEHSRIAAGGPFATRASSAVEDPIAIVGAACRLPGAANLSALWSLLSEGREAVRALPENRFPIRKFWHPRRGEPGKFYARHAGVLDDVESFDAAFFGISAREARQIDPQQRLMLELAWEAQEDAGVLPDALGEAGVYIGASATEYANSRFGDPSSGDAYFMPGNTLSIFSNRISYAFDLHGPSLTVDTACSSSLVALNLACEDLRAGRADAAFVGGVNMLLSPYPFIGFSAAEMLSPTGRCHAFDAAADGYVRAEGGVMLLLKPLSAALRDGDAIHALILATGTNSDGRTAGLSFPSRESQAALLSAVYGQAGVHPDQLAFIEAHGTGTAAGDPVEAGALGMVLGRHRSAPLPIGSVKSNLGHLEPASGLAGLLKAMLALRHRRLPASLHFNQPNPHIDFGELNLEVAAASRALGRGRLIAGINSFGFGGTNAHAIIASPPRLTSRTAASPSKSTPPVAAAPLLLSARSEAALRALAGRWAETSWDDAALRGLARRRTHHMFRLGVQSADTASMKAALAAHADGQAHMLAASGRAMRDVRTVFVFAGNGTQFVGMGQEALQCNPAFRQGVTEADAALAPHLGWSVLAAMQAGDQEIDRAEAAQPMLFALQIGIAHALRAEGVEAGAVVGHSVGEVAAAYWSGCLPLEEAARIVVLRSRHQEMTHGGGMAVLNCEPATAEALIAQAAPGLAIAALNAPASVAVAGDEAGLAELGEAAARDKIFFQRLETSYAYHSRAMDPIQAPLVRALGDIACQEPRLRMVSTVTGKTVDAPLDAGYWWRNVRAPVLFADALASLAGQGSHLFVEIGPRPVLQHYIREILRGAEGQGRPLPTMNRAVGGDPFPKAALACYAAGADIAEAPHFAGPARVRGLPATQWQKERLWYAQTPEAMQTLWNHRQRHPLLFDQGNPDATEWIAHLDTSLHPWLADHQVGGSAVLAAACMIEFACTAGRAAYPSATRLELHDFEIFRPMLLEADRLREVKVRLDRDGSIAIDARPRLAGAGWSRHAHGRIVAASSGPTNMEVAAPTGALSGAALYERAAAAGLQYGPHFQRVAEVALCGAGEAEGRLHPADIDGAQAFDPAALDGGFQVLIALALARAAGEVSAPLPRRFGRIRVALQAGAPMLCRARVTAMGPRETQADFVLLDADNRPILSAEQCWFTRQPAEIAPSVAERSFHEVWLPAPLDPARWPDSRFLALRPVLSEARVGDEDDAEAAMLAAAFVQAKSSEARGGLAVCASELAARLRPIVAEVAAPAGDLPESRRIWQSLLLDCPAFAASAALLAWMGERLDQASQPTFEPEPIPGAPLEQLSGGRAAELAAIMLGDAIKAFAQDWPKNRPLRVLEVHADRGILSRHLLPRLGGASAKLAYTVLEADGEQLARLRPILLTHSPGAAMVQQAAPQGYDVMVAYASGLRGISPNELLARTGALAPGGVLMVVEAAEDPAWRLLGLLSNGSIAGIEAWSRLPAQKLCMAVQGNATMSPFPFALLAASPTAEEIAEEEPPAPCRLCLPPARAGADAAEDATAALMDLADAARSALQAGETLAVVTRGADSDPVEAARRALARVIANEYPAIACRRIDLTPELTATAADECLAAELSAAGGEAETRWTEAGRFVRRLREGLPPRRGGSDAPRRLMQNAPGALHRLRWEQVERRQPEAGEVAIAVKAVGLNFRDVLSAIGMLPDEALLNGFAGATLGMECAGIVEAVGSGVADVAVGDRVMAFASAAHATRIVTDARGTMKLPSDMAFASGATIPVAFLTALYSLETLAALQPGEIVLIHGAAGGVGLAALQYALHVGARVFATAGSPAKRAALRALGAELAMDSRSLSFVADVEAATGGTGVDVVLNALSGEAMERSLDLLRPFGRFLELGKRDFLANSRVGLRPLRRNVTYHAVDVDELLGRRPAIVGKLTARLEELFATAEFKALPYTAFGFSEAADAYRLMRSSGHIGKVVMTADRLPEADPPLAVPGERTVIVSGGLTGFGAATARWLVRAGARHLALLGRRGEATPGAAALREALLSAGAENVAIHACDVADRAALAETLAQVRAALPPIGGVVHAAMVVADGLLASLSQAQIAEVMHAKLRGALALDELTRDDPLSLFLLYSSATTAVGAPGQGAYVAANAAVEAIAVRRRAEGRPGCAVGWGPIRDVGFLARNEAAGKALARRLGALPMRAADALDALPSLLACPHPAPVLAEINWSAAASALPILAEPLFAEVARHRDAAGGAPDLLALLAGRGEEERRDLIAAVIIEEMARVVQTESASLSADAMLADLGLDSLMAVELVVALERRLAVTLPNFAWQDITIRQMARHIAGLFHGAGSHVEAHVDAVAARHLSSEEAASLPEGTRDAVMQAEQSS
jgi:phthiocerol/phenolphthiocerol synthesis type-I polyketide synthase C